MLIFMNIAIIIRRLNVKGGTQSQALHLGSELEKMGHAVVFYTFFIDAERCYPELLAGRRVVALDAREIAATDKRKFWDIIFPPLGVFMRENKLAGILARKIDPATDILNPHDQIAYRVAAFFKKEVKDIPSVWMMNDLPTRRFSVAREVALGRRGTPSIFHRLWHRIVDGYDLRHFIAVQDTVTVLGDRDRAWVQKYFKKEAIVVRSGVDAEKFPFEPRASLGKNTPVTLLAVGGMFPHRRYEDLIDAVAILCTQSINARAVIIGTEETERTYAALLRLRAEEREIRDKIIFAGTLTHEALLSHYRTSHIYISPNHLQSWGLAVFEAMATGLPVIVSKTAGA
ncbi:MAG: glycosyltransferase family 4 protein, partial [Candidatus Sungbacteria bacterium]|nr:glycosyltransferase family 4 protein [Candidatus Sungbacteria bacterium]